MRSFWLQTPFSSNKQVTLTNDDHISSIWYFVSAAYYLLPENLLHRKFTDILYCPIKNDILQFDPRVFWSSLDWVWRYEKSFKRICCGTFYHPCGTFCHQSVTSFERWWTKEYIIIIIIIITVII